MNIYLKIALPGMLAAGVALAGDTPFRCGSRIINTGMSRDEVQASCGVPTRHRKEFRDVRSPNNLVLGQTEVDFWTYEAYSATRLLVFVDGRLQSIDRM